MANPLLTLSPEETAVEIITSLSSIGKWLQAIGALAVLWIIIQVVHFTYNYRRLKRLDRLEAKLQSIETTLKKIPKKKK